MADLVKQKKSINPLTAGVTGIVIGAAGAVAIALADEPTRKRATHKAIKVKSDLQKWGSQKVKTLQQKKETADKVITDVQDDVTKNVKQTDLN